MEMDVSSLPMHEFYSLYGDNISAEVYENFVTPLDRTRGLLIAAYSILFFIGACGNGWVACVISCVMIKSPSGEAPRSVQTFILTLCCCDLLVLSSLAFLIADLAYGRWMIESSWVCLLYLSSESLNKFCSPFLLTALSGLCYLSICQNSNVNRFSNYSIHTPLIVIFFCAVLMFVLVTPVYIYGDVHFVVFENGTELWAVMPKCAFQPPEHVLRVFTVYTFVFGYIVPAALFTYFYSAVLLYVRRHSRRCTVNSLHFWRVAKTTMGLVCFYLVCWTPYWALNMYEYFRPLSTSADDAEVPSDTTVVMGYFIHMLPYVNCCGYPILYTLLNRDITRAYDNVKSGRTRRKEGRLLAASTNCATHQSRLDSARPSLEGRCDIFSSRSPSPTCVSYLASPSPVLRSCNGRTIIRTVLASEMTTLSPAMVHRRSVSDNITKYGSMV